MGIRGLKYQIIAMNKDGEVFMRTAVLGVEHLQITNALRKFVQSEVWYEGDIIKIVRIESDW